MTFVSLPRFYAPDLDPAIGRAVLTPEESHHLARVLRLASGDEAAIFDGRGHVFRARVERADRQRAVLQLVDPLETDAGPAVPVTLVQSVLKGDKMDGVIRDATMAGVHRITPIVAERSQVGLSTFRKGHALERWQRVAISSAKQCGQARLPSIDVPRAFPDWLRSNDDTLRLLLTEPSSNVGPVRPLRDVLDEHRPHAVSCIVGPEGGWSASEHHAAVAAGCVAITLGGMTLRADAAGLVAASILAFALERNP